MYREHVTFVVVAFHKHQVLPLIPNIFLMHQSMTHSDEFKPLYMSVAKNISYVDVDYDAIVRLDVKQTGSSRMFNFLGESSCLCCVRIGPSKSFGGWRHRCWWSDHPGFS